MAAMRLRAEKPELRSVAIEDLAAQILASEGAAPGAGVGGLANLFATKLTPASPAPMRAADLEAPKPTAMIIPAANAVQSGRGMAAGAPRNPPLAPWQVEHLARMEAGLKEPAVEEAPAVVAEAAPEVADEVPAVQPVRSRFAPLLAQKQAELDDINQRISMATQTGQPVPPEMAFNLDVLSREVSQLKGIVAAEEGAAVDPERAAILERQTQRLGREEELVEQARRRAPFEAVMAGGAALAGARPGESFTSALARGLQAGAQSYTGARDAREAALRGIEERRDAFALQRIDAVQKARDEAIALQNAGMAMTENQIRLAGMTREGATAAALAPFQQRTAVAQTKKAEVEAENAPEMARLDIEGKKADIGSTQALADYRRRPPPPRGTGGAGRSGSMTENQFQSKLGALQKERRGLMIKLNDPTVQGRQRAAVQQSIGEIDGQIAELRATRPGAAPGFGPTKQPAAKAPAKAPVAGAKQAPNGKWYVPDPKRPGKFLEVTR